MLRWKHTRYKQTLNGHAIREKIFGLEDGIVSTGGAVIGIAAGTGSKDIVILSGLVIVAVEALSMAAGTYLSSKSNRQLLERYLKDEQEEIATKPAEEIEELKQMYRTRGFESAEIDILVSRITKNKDLWLEEMAFKEFGIGLAQLNETKTGASTMWLAYSIGGFIPIIPFIILSIQSAVLTAFILSVIGLFAIGYWKGVVTKTSVWRSALEMTGVAVSAGLVGYLIGRIVGTITGIEVLS